MWGLAQLASAPRRRRRFTMGTRASITAKISGETRPAEDGPSASRKIVPFTTLAESLRESSSRH